MQTADQVQNADWPSHLPVAIKHEYPRVLRMSVLTVSTASRAVINYHGLSFSNNGVISASGASARDLQAHATSKRPLKGCRPGSNTNPARLSGHRRQWVKSTCTPPHRVRPVVGTLKVILI